LIGIGSGHQDLREQGVSYVWIDPSGGAGDLRGYERRLLEGVPYEGDAAADA
jgi:hypothetical protein